MSALLTELVLCRNAFMGMKKVIFNRNGLPALIQAYKAILMAFNPTGSRNPITKFKLLILVHNWQ
jgi:hypothetical protein